MCTSTHSEAWTPLRGSERRLLTGALRAKGLHLTAQRKAICEAIFGCPGHICAEHILAAVTEREPALKLNKTTVYRALDLFMALHLVTEHKVGEGPAQYEPASRGHHSHLICHICGASQNLDEELAAAFLAGIQSRHGFEADLESHPISGVCPACRRVTHA